MQNDRGHFLQQAILETIDLELPNLQAITDARSAIFPARAGAWSPKQELGHLIDSATNNHVRFARAAIEGAFQGPLYAQDDWVRIHVYQNAGWPMLIGWWHTYNVLLAHLTRNIPEERFSTECTIGPGPAVTLDFLIDDYVLHMKHHLDHIVGRDKITPYPRPASGI
jgi:hypothetical protein